jgi:phosphate-selective porin OprO/OprP
LSRWFAGWCLVFALALPATPALGAETDPPQPQGETPQTETPEVEATADPPRPLTQSELEREIEFLQREMEELLVRIGAAPVTEEQQTKLHDLASRLAEMRAQLESTKELDEYRAEGDGFKARWRKFYVAANDLTNYSSKNGMFRVRLGLKFQLDATAGRESGALEAQVGDIDESFDFRRARIFAKGRFLRRYDFSIVYDFGADAGFKDVYLEGAKYTKYLKWRIGHFKEPFSLARQNSSNNFGFLEWALPVQALTPGRNLGLMFRHTEVNERLFWAVSATTDGKATDDNRTNSDVTFTGRLTGLPLYRNDGRRLLHLGVAYSHRNPADGQTELAARPEARFVPFFVDTGLFSAEETTLVGIEAAWVHESFWTQAEWILSASENDTVGSPEFDGAYIETGWFLTGENRFYRAQDGTFGRLTPNALFRGGNPFSGKGDGGALEITGRFSTLDLNSGAITGGEMQDISVGLNWYLTQASRLMVNYIHSDVKDVGKANIVLFRFQFSP